MPICCNFSKHHAFQPAKLGVCHGLHSQPSDLDGIPTASDEAFIGTPAIGSGTRPPTKGGSVR
jgi:hypothetical protein